MLATLERLAAVRLDAATVATACRFRVWLEAWRRKRQEPMQAILRLLTTKPISKHEYYNPNEPIVISGFFTGITEAIIDRLHADHREDIRRLVKDGSLGLVRRYETDGTSKQLRVITKVPKIAKFKQEAIDSAFKGVTGKDISAKLKTFYPEVPVTEEPKTQKAAINLIEAHVSGFGLHELEDADVPLPTGIDNSIRTILPEPIYIPAVKDFSDDLQTKAGTSFGKILNILLSMIEGDLADADRLFKDLRRRLSRYVGADGEVKDERLDRVKEIESTIQRNLQESFKNIDIELEVPPPEVKSLLSNATIFADDGVRGPIEFKGDGFKRAITFSILRAYVQLAQSPRWRKPEDVSSCRNNFLFLFEEPELYLHPKAQNILFDALTKISTHYQVIVTTHSPLFFTWDAKGTFVKMSKEDRPGDPRPRSVCASISLSELTAKDAYQIISFETSNFGFFAKRIVLVEGESDMIAFPHMARIIEPLWDVMAFELVDGPDDTIALEAVEAFPDRCFFDAGGRLDDAIFVECAVLVSEHLAQDLVVDHSRRPLGDDGIQLAQESLVGLPVCRQTRPQGIEPGVIGGPLFGRVGTSDQAETIARHDATVSARSWMVMSVRRMGTQRAAGNMGGRSGDR